jgi:hypothetical protein
MNTSALAVASPAPARSRSGTIRTSTGNVVLESGSRRSRQNAANELAPRFDPNFVKWIPIVVPGFAVLLALCTYFIVGTVVVR